MSKNLITRILVAAVAIPAILWVCYQGGDWLKGMVLFFAMVAIIEYMWQEGYRLKNFLFWLSLVAVYLLVIEQTPSFLKEYFDPSRTEIFYLVLFFLITGMVFSIGKQSPADLFSKHTRLIWGIVYIGFLYPFVYKISIDSKSFFGLGNSGGDWLLFLFGLLWVGDTAAYFVGKSIGKHKLAPAVSPNKTIEGFVGGLIGSLLIGVLMYFWKFDTITFYHILAIALLCSLFGQLGDLVESMWKRSIGIKDSSMLIPGHGGILDRFDSLLFAAPVMYLYKMYLM